MDSTLQTGTETGAKPIQLSVALPHSPDTRIRLHLTIHKLSLLLFLTTTSVESASTTASVGSFVYAIPNVGLSFDLSCLLVILAGWVSHLTCKKNLSASTPLRSPSAHLCTPIVPRWTSRRGWLRS